MPRTIVDCPDIVIANAAQNSNAVLVDVVHADSDDIILMCNQIDAAKTYVIQVNDKRDGTGNWYNLNDGTNDVTPPSIANKAVIFVILNQTFRIQASVAVASQCTWKMKKTYSMGSAIDAD